MSCVLLWPCRLQRLIFSRTIALFQIAVANECGCRTSHFPHQFLQSQRICRRIGEFMWYGRPASAMLVHNDRGIITLMGLDRAHNLHAYLTQMYWSILSKSWVGLWQTSAIAEAHVSSINIESRQASSLRPLSYALRGLVTTTFPHTRVRWVVRLVFGSYMSLLLRDLLICFQQYSFIRPILWGCRVSAHLSCLRPVSYSSGQVTPPLPHEWQTVRRLCAARD